MTIGMSPTCQDPNVPLSTTFILSLSILLLSWCCRCVRFESNVLYAYCTPFAQGKLVQLKINCQIYRLAVFLFRVIEWCIMQEKIRTMRAPLMIWARSIPVDLVTANVFFFLCRIHLWFRYVGGLYGKSMTSSCNRSSVPSRLRATP